MILSYRYNLNVSRGQHHDLQAILDSQRCSGCGELVPKALSDRVHRCPNCGLVLDRDVNAARNILRAAVVGRERLNVAGYRERAAGILVSA